MGKLGKPHFSAHIPSVAKTEDLKKHVVNEINRLADTVSNQTFYGDVSASNNRLTNLSDPVGEYDAANLHVVKREIKKATDKLYAALHRPNLNKAFNFNDTEFEVIPGGFTIKGVDFSKAFNFDTSMFSNTGDFHIIAQGITTTEIADDAITTPKLIAGAVTTAKLTTNEINLGYGGVGMPVRFRIYDNTGSPIGWIGDDSSNTGYVGAWFKRLLIGGSSPNTTRFFADANGNVVMKSVYVYDNTGTVGWIGNDGTYYGGWFKEFYAGGNGPSSAPLTVDNSGNLTIEDATIQISGNNTTLKVNTTDGFRIDTDSGSWLQMGNGHLYIQDAGSTPATTKYSVFEPERIQCINGHWYGQPIGVSLESVNGYGDVHVSSSIGQTTVWMRGDQGGILFKVSSGSGTPPSGYVELRESSGNPYWYSTSTLSWHTLPFLDAIQTWTGVQTFSSQIVAGGGIRPNDNKMYASGGSSNRWAVIYAGVVDGESATFSGSTGAASVVLTDGYFSSAEGYYTANTSYDAINAPLGGARLKRATLEETGSGQLYMKASSGDTTLSDTSFCSVWYDNTAHALKIRYYDGSSWQTKTINMT